PLPGRESLREHLPGDDASRSGPPSVRGRAALWRIPEVSINAGATPPVGADGSGGPVGPAGPHCAASGGAPAPAVARRAALVAVPLLPGRRLVRWGGAGLPGSGICSPLPPPPSPKRRGGNTFFLPLSASGRVEGGGVRSRWSEQGVTMRIGIDACCWSNRR